MVSDPGPAAEFWAGRRVFITGHTGFKGGWLTLWLSRLGARIQGIGLEPDTTPNLFAAIRINQLCDSTIADVRDARSLSRIIKNAAPEIVFHMAAQSSVRRSYRDPVGTFAANVLGTVTLLDACRDCPSVKAIVVITSDKCYDQAGAGHAHAEGDPLGGQDPYSASKAAAELAVRAYRDLFFARAGVSVATARSGNVIGGGDWAEDRLVPDAIRSFVKSEKLLIRNPAAVRPWQHVAAPLLGYLSLARACTEHGLQFASAWNFGPDPQQICTVRQLAILIAAEWGGAAEVDVDQDLGPPEAAILLLDSTAARKRLGWRSGRSVQDEVAETVAWYRAFHNGGSVEQLRDLMWIRSPAVFSVVQNRYIQIERYRQLRMDKKRIVILGGGGFGTFARDLCDFCGHEPFGILDNFKPRGMKVNGCPVLGSIDLIHDEQLRAKCEFVVAIWGF